MSATNLSQATHVFVLFGSLIVLFIEPESSQTSTISVLDNILNSSCATSAASSCCFTSCWKRVGGSCLDSMLEEPAGAPATTCLKSEEAETEAPAISLPGRGNAVRGKVRHTSSTTIAGTLRQQVKMNAARDFEWTSRAVSHVRCSVKQT